MKLLPTRGRPEIGAVIQIPSATGKFIRGWQHKQANFMMQTNS